MDTFPSHSGNQPAPFIIAGPGQQEEELGFDFWGVLNRRKWLVFLGLVVGMALGGLYNAQCPDVFKSEAKIKIEPKDPLIFQYSNGAGLPGATDLMVRHDQLIGQFNIVNSTLTNNDLMNLRSFEDLDEDKIVAAVMDNLSISQNKDEQTLYELSFYSPYPEDAEMVLNNLMATYEKDLEEQYKNTSKQIELQFIDIHDDYKLRYEKLDRQLDELYADNPATIIASGQLNQHQIRLRELGLLLQEQKSELSIDVATRERVLVALSEGPEKIEACLWNLIQQGLIMEFENDDPLKNKLEFELRADQEIQILKLQLIEVSRHFGPSHPDYKHVEAMIAQWITFKESYAAEGTGINIPDPDEKLRRFVLYLDQNIGDLEAKIPLNLAELNMNEREAQKIADASRKAEKIRQAMDDLNEIVQIAKNKLIEISSNSDESAARSQHEGYRFQTLMNATYGEKVWPILPVILGIGGLLGCLVGFGLGCLVELADKTFHTPEQIMKQLQIPLIGHIPVIGSSKRYLVENSLIDPMVCTYHRPKSQVAEAFRAVRTSLFFNTQGKEHSVIQVTSPTPGDGKSTLAANLAVSIAQSGKRVLLVDGDMRRPRQHGTFGITAKEGFATVLSGQSAWRDVLIECEEIEGLSLMPCGSKPNNPAELSTSPQVKVLIEEMRNEFDFVIIDTPPMLAVTDPCPIAARVDGVLLCIRIKKNVRVSAERTIEMLSSLGATCIGLVVNGVGSQSGYGSQYTYSAYRAGYSYSGYGYGYGYGTNTGKYYEDDQRGRQAEFGPKRLEEQPSESSEHPPVV